MRHVSDGDQLTDESIGATLPGRMFPAAAKRESDTLTRGQFCVTLTLRRHRPKVSIGRTADRNSGGKNFLLVF